MVLLSTGRVYTTTYFRNEDANAFLTKITTELEHLSTLQGWSKPLHQHLLRLVDLAEYQIVPCQLEERVVVTECQNAL